MLRALAVCNQRLNETLILSAVSRVDEYLRLKESSYLFRILTIFRVSKVSKREISLLTVATYDRIIMFPPPYRSSWAHV